MALDDYLSDPSQDCLARLFDAVNAMDLSGAPTLTRAEKLVMRASERKDIFVEKFAHLAPLSHAQPANAGLAPSKVPLQHRSTNSGESYSSFEEGILIRKRNQDENRARERDNLSRKDRADTESTTATAVSTQSHGQHSPSDSSFSLGGSAVWVGDESGLDIGPPKDLGGDSGSVVSLAGSGTMVGSARNRRSTDASSSSSHAHSKDQNARPAAHTNHSYYDPSTRPGMAKDTHFYHTSVAYKDHQLPIKMPLSTFPEEVGDVSGLGIYCRIAHRNTTIDSTR